MKEFKPYLKSKQRFIDKALKELLKKAAIPIALKKAMGYSLLAGGKRLRPALTLMVDDVFRKKYDCQHHPDIINLALSLECIHTYSLIHDDLPCMDDDDLRRGQPTCHVKFGEATAVLAGDALLTLAFELIGELTTRPQNAFKIISILARQAGGAGMVGGQVLDMLSEGKKISLNQMRTIHQLKTGALIEASVILPGIYQGVPEKTQQALLKYSQLIGIAFQIVDDILDVTGSSQALGKSINSDINNDKSTYVSLIGLDKSRQKVNSTIQKSKRALKAVEGDSRYLSALSDYIVSRNQ